MSDKKAEDLRQVGLFANLDTNGIREVERLADEVRVPGGTVLFAEGDVADEFVVLTEGTVEVLRDGRSVATLGRGDFLGEISLMLGRPRTTTAVCTSDCTMFVFALREFHTLIDDLGDVRTNVLETLAHRLADAPLPQAAPSLPSAD